MWNKLKEAIKKINWKHVITLGLTWLLNKLKEKK